jgi:hypothetical protein
LEAAKIMPINAFSLFEAPALQNLVVFSLTHQAFVI